MMKKQQYFHYPLGLLLSFAVTCSAIDPIHSHLRNKIISLQKENTTAEQDHQQHRDRRRLAADTLLGVRVIANDGSAQSAPSLRQEWVDDAFTFADQFEDCSYGKFRPEFVDSIAGVDIEKGVIEVTIDIDVTGTDRRDVAEEAAAQLSDDLNANVLDAVDALLICLPPGATKSDGNPWVAFSGGSTGNARYNVFNEGYCDHLQMIVHELSHSLDLQHAQEGAEEYGDDSGIMGSSYSGDKKYCYNGSHGWRIGWYETNHKSMDPLLSSQVVTLVGVADFADIGTDTIILELDTNGGENFYIAFNRKDGINIDTQEGGDQVMVTRLQTNNKSTLLAKLDEGDKYLITNFAGTTKTVEIRVDEIDLTATPPFARVFVGLEVLEGPLDVVFLVDNTGSFQDDMDDFQTDGPAVIDDILAVNDDVKFGLAIFRDYYEAGKPWGEDGDFPYKRLVDIPVADDDDDGSAAVKTTITEMVDGEIHAAGGGGDLPESQLTALYEVVAGAEDDVMHFRPEAVKIIILWTDSGFHDSDEETDYPGRGYSETITALNNAIGRRLEPTSPLSPRVVGITNGNEAANEAVKHLADDTGALAGPNGVDCNGDGITDIAPGLPIVCETVGVGGIAVAFEAVIEATIEALSPVAICKSGTVNTEEGLCTASFNVHDDTACIDPPQGPVTLSQDPPGPYGVGTTHVTLWVTNEDGLTSSCQGDVEVLDNEYPKMTSPPDDAEVECTDVPPPATLTATDNCDTIQITPEKEDPVVSFTETRTNGICDADYVLDRQWSTQDLVGHTVYKFQQVTIVDTTPPIISCNVRDIDPSETSKTSPVVFTPTANDNCSTLIQVEITDHVCYKTNNKGKIIIQPCGVAIEGDTASISQSGGVGTVIELSVTATDECGNTAEKLCTVTVVSPPLTEQQGKPPK